MTKGRSHSICPVPRSIPRTICSARSCTSAVSRNVQYAPREPDSSPISLPIQCTTPMTILGISIGTTRTGVCVMRDGVLIDRQTHNFPTVWSDNKLRIIINQYKRYIRKRQVKAIIVKVPPPRKQTKATKLILKRLEALAKEHSCHFDLITKNEMQHQLHLHSTKALTECARLLYPELNAIYQKGEMNDHRYYKKLFEAVLAAHIFWERIKE